MNLSEAQRLINQRDMLCAEIPPEVEFRERLTANSECIVRQCGQLVPGPSAITVNEHFDDTLRITRVVNPAVKLLSDLKAAAAALGRLCTGYDPSHQQDILASAATVEESLDAFVRTAPAMATNYYSGPILNALQQVRTMVTTPLPKAVKR